MLLEVYITENVTSILGKLRITEK